MEFNKLRGFWKSNTEKPEKIINPMETTKTAKTYNANSNNNSSVNRSRTTAKGAPHLEALDEIRPEVTSEGYGLRTPYGTHLNLDFVKYCEDLATGQNFRRTSSLRKPRSRTTSTASITQTQHVQARLAGGPSNESLDSLASESDGTRSGAQAENTLMETRRRLEAFRSFRTKRHKSSEHPPQVTHQNGYNNFNNSRGSTSPGPSSGTLTPGTLGSILGGGQVTPQHLQLVREQMTAALTRLRELEEQVKTIPVLQVKISVLQQEKKHLLDELQKTENGNFPQSPLNGHQTHHEDLESLGQKSSPRKSLLSTSSSGISSSCSSQSSLPSPRSPMTPSTLSPPTLHRPLANEPSPGPKTGPPLPPKRKYRSLAVGESGSIWDIVCYSKSEKQFTDVASSCGDLQPVVDVFSSNVEPCEIDAAFDIFPPPPKTYDDNFTNTDILDTVECFAQTNLETKESSVQTSRVETNSIGCSNDVFYDMVDNSTATKEIQYSDASTFISPAPIPTSDKDTTTYGLLTSTDACVGNHSTLTTTATSPITWPGVNASTSSADLIALFDAACGPDSKLQYTDARIQTDTTPAKDVRSIACEATPPVVALQDKATVTAADKGRWCSYADLRTVSCGDDFTTQYKCSGTNTVLVAQSEQATNTACISTQSRSAMADIRPLTTESCSNTPAIVRCDTATDCSDKVPCSTTVFTNTPEVLLETNATQYDSGIFDEEVVDKELDIERRNVGTSTEDLEQAQESPSKEIDSYVDKVQSLLAEQQHLLAENYQEIAEVWDETDGKETDKITRFVNPAFAGKSPSSDVTDASPADSELSPAISASFSLMTSSGDDESDDDKEQTERPTLLPLPSLAAGTELKSIMRKPGTPVSEKKFLRFAEGVKTDETSSEEEYSSSEDEEDEISNETGSLSSEDSDVEEDRDVQEKAEVVKTQSPPTDQEKNEEEMKRSRWTYSDEFVKKVDPVEVKETLEKDEDLLASTESKIEVQDSSLHLQTLPSCQVNTTKYQFTSEVLDACDMLEKHLRNPKSVDRSELMSATALVQQEWFNVAASNDSSKKNLDDFVTDLADTSLPVLRKVVNMTDASGNTVLHYAISHGKMDIVELLLGIDELNVNKANQAGYTASMLAALCEIRCDEDAKIVKLLFEKSDINCHAKEAGQTALMLAVSHGRLQTSQLLIKCGAEVNARDDDGSTALMCAAEHNHLEIVKLLLAQQSCDATLADNDGSTALSIAMEAGRKDISILLYAHANFKSVSQKIPRPRLKCSSMIPSPVRNPLKS
uniref:KN motif and ankyrin repeat domain-containing protein 1-like n=1 Tax=Phallusia mammillata TaxID=59560 RepID=A0A6F9DG10_9ASCI|nr:KN motif and ankyrin repeat domain-containing protein 1-like [Phallusia mammillata]